MKQKTKQAARKRFQFTGTGKVTRRAVKQAHFNSRATGSETRQKRTARFVHPTDLGRITDLVPYPN